jgi:hypothetical protein
MIRFDLAGRLARAEKTPTGGARLTAHLARTGVQNYQMRDGSTRREYRAPSEVFAPDSLASFVGAPVTIGHPGSVSASSWKRDAVGVVLMQPSRTKVGMFDFVKAVIDVNDVSAMSRIDSGELEEISMGYDCDFEPRPGFDTASGEHFDGYQRNIRINHLALLPVGHARAGRDARLLLDSAEEIELGSRTLHHGRGVALSEFDRGRLKAEKHAYAAHVNKVVAQLNRR